MAELGAIVDDGTPVEVADAAVAGMAPMPPFALLGLVGPAIALHNNESLAAAFPDRFSVPEGMRAVVAAGQDLKLNVEPAEHERTGCRREELAEGEEAEQGDDEQARRKPWTSPGAHMWTGGSAHARTAPVVARAGLCP